MTRLRAGTHCGMQVCSDVSEECDAFFTFLNLPAKRRSMLIIPHTVATHTTI